MGERLWALVIVISFIYQKTKDEHVLNDISFVFVIHVSVREKKQNTATQNLCLLVKLAFLIFGC